MKCPKCYAPMSVVNHHDHKVHRCEGCHGLWFAKGQLNALKALPQRNVLDHGDAELGAAFDELPDVSCPECAFHRMQHTAVKGQEYMAVDHCPQCEGDFLDAGEFVAYQRPSIWGHVKAVCARIAA